LLAANSSDGAHSRGVGRAGRGRETSVWMASGHRVGDRKQGKPKYTTYRAQLISRTTTGSALVSVFDVKGLRSQRLCLRVGLCPGMRMASRKKRPATDASARRPYQPFCRKRPFRGVFRLQGRTSMRHPNLTRFWRAITRFWRAMSGYVCAGALRLKGSIVAKLFLALLHRVATELVEGQIRRMGGV